MEELNFTLKTTLEEYMKYHYYNTMEMAKLVGSTNEEWKLIWTINYYKERCELLEKKLGIL